ncbi:MAG: CDF family Co(II)/Ni(II) efflux transporter DmeF [Pseudomonadota bacterium]
MHGHTLQQLQHRHDFSVHDSRAERRTYLVLLLTALTMVVEIAAGSLFGSMALLADGWHMGTHVAAFMITVFAYRHARRHADNPDYSFGTGKVSVLGGYTSAIVLVVVALLMLLESVQRLFLPQAIHFNEAIMVAAIGLLVNVVSALLLKDGHTHAPAAEPDHEHEHAHRHHHDHNLRAAYLHVLADALTSVLAITALLCGKYLDWNWLDPVMGAVGACIIARWSYGLLAQTGPILLDASIDSGRQQAIRSAIEHDADNRIADMHVWKVGANDYAAIIALVTHVPRPAEHYRQLLAGFAWLSHVTIEVNACVDAPCALPGPGPHT